MTITFSKPLFGRERWQETQTSAQWTFYGCIQQGHSQALKRFAELVRGCKRSIHTSEAISTRFVTSIKKTGKRTWAIEPICYLCYILIQIVHYRERVGLEQNTFARCGQVSLSRLTASGFFYERINDHLSVFL